MQKKLFILITLFIVEILRETQAMNTYFGNVNFVSTSTFTKSHDLNSLYAVGSSDFKIYRLNYTRNITAASFNYNISTTHTKKIRAIAVSQTERYIATGSEDFTI
jgi:WD40 repeat protein